MKASAAVRARSPTRRMGAFVTPIKTKYTGDDVTAVTSSSSPLPTPPTKRRSASKRSPASPSKSPRSRSPTKTSHRSPRSPRAASRTRVQRSLKLDDADVALVAATTITSPAAATTAATTAATVAPASRSRRTIGSILTITPLLFVMDMVFSLFYCYVIPREVDTLAKMVAVVGLDAAVVTVVYGFPWLVCYYWEPTMNAIAQFKFNQAMPSTQTTMREMLTSYRTCLIGAAYDIFVRYHIGQGNITVIENHSWPMWLFYFLLVIVWTDFHVYAHHRIMHIDFLYKNFHYIHHACYNPEPWSGLSFHYVEACTYYTALLLPFVLPLPYWHITMIKVMLEVTPTLGHLGYGGWTGGSKLHYIHHTSKNVNYGGTAFWDKLAGTHVYRIPKVSDHDRLVMGGKAKATTGLA